MVIDKNVKRDGVEKLIRFHGRRQGDKMKNRAMEWKKLAE